MLQKEQFFWKNELAMSQNFGMKQASAKFSPEKFECQRYIQNPVEHL